MATDPTLPADAPPALASRKADHIELCATGDVGFVAKTTLLDDVEFVHDALPELSLDELDTSVSVLGKQLRAPIFIAAMTGGTERATDINRRLAALAERRGYGFGLGSQRAMLPGVRGEAAAATYRVRDVAPTVLLLGNIGGVQAAALGTAELQGLVDDVGADALCVHLNPAMEVVQPEGDRDFRGVRDALRRLGRELSVPVVAKETGCGLGPRAARRIHRAGVRWVDVSGAGGTSWVAVETARASGERRQLGEALRDWGVPTAASVAYCARVGFEGVIATGGVATGLDVARALALGAVACGIARPVLQALLRGGEAEAERYLDGVEAELRAIMLLTGSRSVRRLRRAPRLVGARLQRWLSLDE
jgi:isopentenyl-diphosphate delta-isomerase